MRKTLALIIAFSVLAASVSFAGWTSGYNYRKKITITGAVNAGTNYQVPVNIYSGSGTDGSGNVYLNSHAHYFPNDIYFTASDGTTALSYWNEYDTPNKFWVKVADDLGSTNSVYVYYGLTGGDSAKSNPLYASVNAVWKRYASNPVLAVGSAGSWDDFWVLGSSIIKDGNTYYMFYTGAANKSVGGSNYLIGVASSTDGDSWTKYAGNPVLNLGSANAWDSSSSSNPTVWKSGASNWYMIYTGSRSGSFIHLGLATANSPLGPWTKYASNPIIQAVPATWESAGVFAAAANIYQENGTSYLYYTGCTDSAGNGTWKIGLAATNDPAFTSWTKSAGNPVFSGSGTLTSKWDDDLLEPTVYKFNGKYYMWYQANPAPSANRSSIGLAASNAIGTGWVKQYDYPVLDNATTDHTIANWDDAWTEAPILLDFGTHWRLYYGASRGNAFTPRMQEGYVTYENTGSGNDTFILFDDFNGRNPNAAKWNAGSINADRGEAYYSASSGGTFTMTSAANQPYPLEINGKARVGGTWSGENSVAMSIIYDTGWAVSGYRYNKSKDSVSDFWKLSTAAGLNSITTESIVADTYYKMSMSISGNNQVGKTNGTIKGSLNTTPGAPSTRIGISVGRTSPQYYSTFYDWVFARKYTDTGSEPAVSAFGAEELNPAVMHNMLLFY